MSVAAIGSGREYASPYLSLGHWAYDYIDLLVARGRVTGLTPLLQPYRRIDIAGAVLEAEAEGRLAREQIAWIAAIKRELADEVEVLQSGRPQELSVNAPRPARDSRRSATPTSS